jgi:hypothetical protein
MSYLGLLLTAEGEGVVNIGFNLFPVLRFQIHGVAISGDKYRVDVLHGTEYTDLSVKL